MLAIRTTYDGKAIRIPEDAKGMPPCRVIVVFEEGEPSKDLGWLRGQEQALTHAWDDAEDAIYDGA